jgi:hypothetical protein
MKLLKKNLMQGKTITNGVVFFEDNNKLWHCFFHGFSVFFILEIVPVSTVYDSIANVIKISLWLH